MKLTHGRGYVYSIQYHIVWCVKYRRKILTGQIENDLISILNNIAADNDFKIIECNTDLDHVHLLVDCSPQNYIPDMLKALKGVSARLLMKKYKEELKKMLEFVREGDVVITESISRIARNTKDLLSIVDELTEKKVEFISLKESIDTSTPAGKFMLTVFGALAELERENILQRQAEGIAIAKANGVYTGRKPQEIDEEKFIRMCQEWQKGERTAVSIKKEFGFSTPTFYKKARERGFEPPTKNE